MSILWRVLDLYFVAASQIDSRISSFFITKLCNKLKIIKFLFTNQISSCFLVNQDTIFYHPLTIITRSLPSGKIFSIEKLDRLSPLCFACTNEIGSLHPSEIEFVPFISCNRTFDSIPY